jgi:hypothetical protein
VYQGTQKRAPQGASESRQITLPQSKPITSVVQPAGQIHPLRTEANGKHLSLSENKWPANRDKPGYSGLLRDKGTKYVFRGLDFPNPGQVPPSLRSFAAIHEVAPKQWTRPVSFDLSSSQLISHKNIIYNFPAWAGNTNRPETVAASRISPRPGMRPHPRTPPGNQSIADSTLHKAR